MSRYPQAQKWELNSWYLLQVGWATNIGTMNQTPVPWKRKYTPARGHISRLLLLFTALLLLDPWALKLLLTQWTWIRFSQFGSAPFFSFCSFHPLSVTFPSFSLFPPFSSLTLSFFFLLVLLSLKILLIKHRTKRASTFRKKCTLKMRSRGSTAVRVTYYNSLTYLWKFDFESQRLAVAMNLP